MAAKKDEKKQDLRQVPLHMQYGHKVIFKAMGFTSEELSLPRIAIVNSWSEQSPGHSHLRAISEGVKAGVRMAGGMPFEINVIGPCSVLNAGFHDMQYDLPQREAILASIESALHVGYCHGWVGIGSCETNRTGHASGGNSSEPALRLHRRRPDAAVRLRRGEVRIRKGMEIVTEEFNKLQAGTLSARGVRADPGGNHRLLRDIRAAPAER